MPPKSQNASVRTVESRSAAHEDHRPVVPVRSAPFEIATLDLAAPLDDEVLVRLVASGMCHTDLHARDGYFTNLTYPVVCGP
jgi:Zn-dependent alcohol dehydrogenase